MAFVSPFKEDSVSQSIEFFSQHDPSSQSNGRSKTFHDRVHDQMTFHPVICAIIDTPQFQRLRDLHQLGNCRYIYPGACNTRFEHSLGVCHLAMKMLRQIKTNHEEEVGTVDAETLNISKEDILCVGIAGLCHDLGHGPLSHMFEQFVNKVRRQKETVAVKGIWEHEAASIQMFEYLLTDNSISLASYGLGECDVEFIKLLIHGLTPHEPWPEKKIGRPEQKRFLFDIVANQRNGIDVDKMDYFLRDSMSCFGKLPDIHVDRIVQCARVCWCDGQTQVCFQEKVAMSLGELFQLRAKLHKFVYQHRVTLVLDHMTIDALCEAEDRFYITVPRTGKRYTLSETVEDMEAYVRTGDWLANALQWSESPELHACRDILTRIRTRSLYTLVGMYNFKREKQDHSEYVNQMRRFLPADVQETMAADNIFVACSKIKLGSSGDKVRRDPLDNVRFFNPKKSLDTAYALSDQRRSPVFYPGALEEYVAFIFSRDPKYSAALHEAFNGWWARRAPSADVATPVSFAQPSPYGRKRLREPVSASMTTPLKFE